MRENPEKLSELHKKALALPKLPGVYIMKDASGKIIYIGKAKKLKNRVVQYFRNISAHLPKVYQMVIRVDDFEHIICENEFEALVLECNLIKRHTPKYNILLKDDKGYHYIKISSGDYPKISTAKQSDVSSDKSGARFIGPYMSGFVVKRMAEDANKIFRLPTCSRVFPRDFRKQRPCLQYHIGLCSAPCTGKISVSEYSENFRQAEKYIRGNGSIDIAELKRQMEKAADSLDFELAARLRDRINAVEKLRESQKIFIDNKASCDFAALSATESRCCICVISYREGRLCDSSQNFFDTPADFSELFSQFISQFYSSKENIPKEIAVNITLPDRAVLQQLLSERAGKKVSLSQPQKGERYKLLLMAQNNAAEGLAAQSEISGREIAALDELTRILSLPAPPEYIESYDISNLGERHMVGGMIVYKGGRPFKSAYRKFTIKDQLIQDDYSAMRQVIRRRFEEYLAADDHSSGFGKLPDLILLDGGKGHVSAVAPVLSELKINVPLFGMVKDGRHRTRAITDGDEISISSNRSAFSLISRIQDEVHRYTFSFQSETHKKTAALLSLTKIEGIGKNRAAALFARFKTIKAISEASCEELCTVSGITPAIAERIQEYFNS